MNYTPIKKAMLAIGHKVSEGDAWLATDLAAFRDFAHFTLNIPNDKCHAILQYPEQFPVVWAQINSLAGDTIELAAPIDIPEPAAAPVDNVEQEASVVEAPVVNTEPEKQEAEPEIEQAPVIEIDSEVEEVEQEVEKEVEEQAPVAAAPLTFNVFGADKE